MTVDPGLVRSSWCCGLGVAPLIGEQAAIDSVRQPPFQTPQRLLGRLAGLRRDKAALMGMPNVVVAEA
jgi:hypothetical protein